MNRPGTLTAPRSLPHAPRSDDPMAILAVLGDPERVNEAREYLAELRALLADNKRVTDEARTACNEAETARRSAEAAEADVAAAAAALARDTAAAERRLAAERAALVTERRRVDDLARASEAKAVEADRLCAQVREVRDLLAGWSD